MGKRRNFTKEERDQALARLDSGETLKQVADSLGVWPSTLTYWKGHRSPSHLKKGKKKRAPKRNRNATTLMTLSVPPASSQSGGKLTLIRGSVDEVAALLKQLQE